MTILSKPIALVGPMGCGKSTIGKMLSQELGTDFIDSDHSIMTKFGMNISEIFDQFGEKFFRIEEENLITKLESERNIVLATGGGAVTSLRVRDLLKSKFISIFLNVDTETLWARICKNTQIRPLINVPKGNKKMERLFKQRLPYYYEADIIIESNVHDEKLDIVKAILKKLKICP